MDKCITTSIRSIYHAYTLALDNVARVESKYRQSIAFRNIYIVGHFLWLAGGESYRKTSESGTGRR